MIGPVARIGDAIRVGPATSWLVAVTAVVGVTVVAGVATRLNLLPMVLVIVLGVFATVVSFRWPLVTLALFAIFIPIEEVVLLDGVGTISRIAAIMFAVTYGIPRVTHLALGAMPRAAWLYVVWATLSLGWAINPNAAGAELPTLIQLFVVAVLIADFVVRRPSIVRPVLWVYSLSATITALVGVGSYLTRGVAESRAVALSTDPAQFAAILVPAFVFGLFEALNGQRRLLGAAIALVTSMGVVVSGTRGAWVAVVAVVALFVLPQLPGRQRVAAIAAVAVLLVAAYQLPGVADLIAERSANALSTGGAGRTDIWTVAGHIYQSAPVLGVGFANFPIAYTPEAVAAANITSAYRIAGYAPHNLIVGTAVELGPIGLILLAWFLGPLVLRRGWGPDAATVQAALASLLVVAMFLDILANRKQVWLIIGMAAGLGYLARQAEDHGVMPQRRWLGWLRQSSAPPATVPVIASPEPDRPPSPGARRAARIGTEIQPPPTPRKSA